MCENMTQRQVNRRVTALAVLTARYHTQGEL